jgi:hypothetical protein
VSTHNWIRYSSGRARKQFNNRTRTPTQNRRFNVAAVTLCSGALYHLKRISIQKKTRSTDFCAPTRGWTCGPNAATMSAGFCAPTCGPNAVTMEPKIRTPTTTHRITTPIQQDRAKEGASIRWEAVLAFGLDSRRGAPQRILPRRSGRSEPDGSIRHIRGSRGLRLSR